MTQGVKGVWLAAADIVYEEILARLVAANLPASSVHQNLVSRVGLLNLAIIRVFGRLRFGEFYLILP